METRYSSINICLYEASMNVVETLVHTLKGERISNSCDHYIIHYAEGSFAEKNIRQILADQEECFQEICTMLEFESKLHIQCFLFESPFECGRHWGALNPGYFKENETPRCSAFALYPNLSFCTFSEEINAMGPHEDTHLIMMEMFQDHPLSTFILEGIAVATGKQWWELDLHQWARYLTEKELVYPVDQLIEEDIFFRNDSNYTYPLAGSFTSWYMESFGLNRYKQFYQDSIKSRKAIQDEVASVLPDYRKFLDRTELDEDTRKIFEKSLSE